MRLDFKKIAAVCAIAACASAMAADPAPASAPAASVARANPMRPGAWESKTEASLEGKPQAAKSSTVCVDQSWVDAQRVYDPSPRLPIAEAKTCKNEDYKREGSKATWTTRCELEGGGQATVKFDNDAKADSIAFSSVLEATMGNEKRSMNIRTTMRRIGDECPKGATKLSVAPSAAASTASAPAKK